MGNTYEDYINYRIAKSRSVFDDALLLAENERWNSCVNRLYYSSFYLISALLYKTGVKAETHNGVKTQFNLLYIKTGLLRKDSAKLYSNLFDWRQESDYADFVDFNEATVKPLLRQVEEFNNMISELILQKQI